MHCFYCQHSELRKDNETQRLSVERCPGCDHRTATIASRPPHASLDYHAQYEGAEYKSSLEATRRRQAKLILDRIERDYGTDPGLLDFGAGLGWFLEAAQSRGWKKLAGADTSAIAVEGLRQRGILAFLLAENSDWKAFAGFSPRVVTVLDVVEHFSASELQTELKKISAFYGEKLEGVVIKVPSSNGISYRLAEGLSRLGKASLLERLYQIDTFPPHFQYFSKKSFSLMGKNLGWQLTQLNFDLDFEPDSLFGRTQNLVRVPAFIGKAFGRAFAWTAKTFGLFDSQIGFWRLRAVSAR